MRLVTHEPELIYTAQGRDRHPAVLELCPVYACW